MINNTIIYSHWRSGSNLLSSIFREKLGFYFLDDYYLQLDKKLLLKNIQLDDTQKQIFQENYNKIFNNYLCNISTKSSTVNTLLKIMPLSVNIVDDNILNCFPNKILLYRKNLYDITKSFSLAVLTNVFSATQEVEQYVGTIDEKFYEHHCGNVLYHFQLMMEANPEVEITIEYETDLVPYINKNPTGFNKQTNPLIKNEDNLKEIHTKIFGNYEHAIVNYFLEKRNKNTESLEEYLTSLKHKIQISQGQIYES